jgi:hypothetical protein
MAPPLLPPAGPPLVRSPRLVAVLSLSRFPCRLFHRKANITRKTKIAAPAIPPITVPTTVPVGGGSFAVRLVLSIDEPVGVGAPSFGLPAAPSRPEPAVGEAKSVAVSSAKLSEMVESVVEL